MINIKFLLFAKMPVYFFRKQNNLQFHFFLLENILPDGQAEKSRKRKKNTALRKQNHITEETLFCAGWIVVVTSLGAGYCSEEILYLYRNRWQVELLFVFFCGFFLLFLITVYDFTTFIDDTLAAELTVLRHSLLFWILCCFRYFSRKWHKIPAGEFVR